MYNLDGLWWLLILAGPLLLLQRLLHREIQSIFLLATRRADVAMVLFSIIFFPGVVLHEFSHYVIALILGVPTGRMSLIPRVIPTGNAKQGGSARLQLGFVETAHTDLVRDALIGLAPLLFGGLFIAYVGLNRLELNALWESFIQGGEISLINSLSMLSTRPDFWIWFYFLFAISSTMMPSASDRRAWLSLLLALGLLLLISLLVGAGPWLIVHAAPVFNQALRAMSAVFGISVAVHLALLPPVYLIRKLLVRLTGLEVV